MCRDSSALVSLGFEPEGVKDMPSATCGTFGLSLVGGCGLPVATRGEAAWLAAQSSPVLLR